MGREARCICRYKRKTSEGKALLETDELVFRGDFRLVIPLKKVDGVASRGQKLTVEFSGEKATFELGEVEARRWAERISDPPSLLEKLGVKGDSVVYVSNVPDDGFITDLEKGAGKVLETRPGKNVDIIFAGIDKRDQLARLTKLKAHLAPKGALWVIRPKGSSDISEADVLSGGRKAGLVDVKVARFSKTHTAEKFVIPVADRPKT